MSVWNAVQFCTFSIAEEAADMQSLLQLRKLIPKKNIPFSLLFVRSLKPDSRRQDLSKKEVAGERERETKSVMETGRPLRMRQSKFLATA